MRPILILAICLCPALTLFAKPLTRTIGNPNSLSAQVSLENTDTTKEAFDSLCARYWFITYNNPYPKRPEYDYRITIIRKTSSAPGTITIFGRREYRPDTLDCDSLGFNPHNQYDVDTVKTDTTVIHWNYLRPTKRRTQSLLVPQVYSNHVKILLKSGSTMDSIIFSRQNVELSSVMQPSIIGRDSGVPFSGSREIMTTALFDIRGRKISSTGNLRQILIYLPEAHDGKSANHLIPAGFSNYH